MIKQAFYQVVENAKPAEASYVSLYVSAPFYGGPEEGGWWGQDDRLVAYHPCSNPVEAELIQEQVEALAEKPSKDAKDAFNRQCASEVERVEQHDPMADASDYYPEVDGEETYWVAIESVPGSLVDKGCRHYE